MGVAIDESAAALLLAYLDAMLTVNEHINLTGDYIWRRSELVQQGQFRPLHTQESP